MMRAVQYIQKLEVQRDMYEEGEQTEWLQRKSMTVKMDERRNKGQKEGLYRMERSRKKEKERRLQTEEV